MQLTVGMASANTPNPRSQPSTTRIPLASTETDALSAEEDEVPGRGCESISLCKTEPVSLARFAMQEKTDAASAAIADEGTALDSIISKYSMSATDREGVFACLLYGAINIPLFAFAQPSSTGATATTSKRSTRSHSTIHEIYYASSLLTCPSLRAAQLLSITALVEVRHGSSQVSNVC